MTPRALGVFDIATPSYNITPHLKLNATFQQPICEVHTDEVAEFGFNGRIDNAVFAHAWAPDGRGMLTCGGPLAMGIRGCYLSLWS